VRIWVDARDEYTPGWKFNEWELKGVPVRVEIGPRDVQAGHVTFVRRDTSARSTAPMGEVLLGLTRLFEDIQRALLTKARAFLEANTRPSTNFAELKAILDAHGGFVEGGWCGSVECEDAVKQETGADIRLIPLGADPPPDNVRCTFCGKPAMTTAVFGRAY
jgi:prolyl-tRNA synthetase